MSNELTYVIELPKSTVLLLAQLLHLYNKSEFNGPLGKKSLEILQQETNCVSFTPEKHEVYDSLRAPKATVEANFGSYFSPVEHSSKVQDVVDDWRTSL